MRRIILGLVMLWAALFGACQASAQLMMTGAAADTKQRRRKLRL